MTQTLSSDLVARYRAEGVLFPRPAVGPEAAADLLAKFEALERRDGGAISRRTNHKPHLLLCWLAELVRDPRILDQVEALIGPDILCWATDFFVKNPGDQKRVSWHQDSTYWGLSSPEVVPAWIAFTPSTTQSGCLRVVPGSHLKDQLPHRDTFAPTNMLSRGQEVAVEVKEGDALDVVLAPGDMSLHNVRLIHGSEPNDAAHRRIGFAIRYVPTRIRQLNGTVDSASLVRGKDAFGNFTLEPAPAADFHPDAVAFHTQNYDLHMNILYAGAEQRPDKAG
jgi:ectoine hydroxylase-related dioxygenase (phytanoyl-CoA dioxygenase family)